MTDLISENFISDDEKLRYLYNKILSVKSDNLETLLSYFMEQKDFGFDFINNFVHVKKMTKLKNCKEFNAGADYVVLKSMINKKLNIVNDNKELVSLDDISKMSLKERMNYKDEQFEINSKHNIYDDIKFYLENEAKPKLKNETNIEKVYNEVVIQETNDLILSNILNNKKIYIGLVIVRKERLQNLYEKLAEMNKI